MLCILVNTLPRLLHSLWKRYCQILLFRQGSRGQKYHFPQFRNVQHDSFHSAFQGLLYACDYLNSKWFYHADILKLVYLTFNVLFILYKHSPYGHQILQSLYWRAVVHTSHHPKDFQQPGFSFRYVPSCGPKYTSLPSLGQSTLDIIHQISVVVQTLPCYFGQINIQNKYDYCYMYIVHIWGKLCPLITFPLSFSPVFSFLRVNKCFIKKNKKCAVQG